MRYVDEFLGIDDSDDTYAPENRLDSHYCKHGTYIGPPGGADILCGECESE
jgi:hypothetical protein